MKLKNLPLPVSSLMGRISGKSASAWDIHMRAMRDAELGKDVIVLSVGDPEFETPDPITEAAIQALRSGDTHYTEMRGKQNLRDAIAARHAARTGQDVNGGNVVVLSGAQSALFASSLCLLEQGDEVITFDPIYTTYEATLGLAGARIVSLPLSPAHRFQPDLAAVEAAVTKNTRAVFLANPSNPTGTVLTRDVVEGLAALALKHDLWIVTDEVYADLVFEGRFHHFASVPGIEDRLITISSLSKSHAMTGWRVGWVVAPEVLADQMENLTLCMLYGLPGFIQEAGVTAIQACDASTLDMREAYRVRRDRVMALLSAIPDVTLVCPDAGMFLLMDVSAYGLDNASFTTRLYEETGVSILDAEAFGSVGRGFVRIAFAPAMPVLEQGCARIAGFMQTLRTSG